MDAVDAEAGEACGRSRSHTGESTVVADMDSLDSGGRSLGADKAEDVGTGREKAIEMSEIHAQESAGPPAAVLSPVEWHQIPAAVAAAPSAGMTENEAEDETYPEGGLRAWMVVAGSWLALFSSLGLMNTMATFQTYITTHQLQGYSEGTIGWIFSVYAFLCFFCGIYAGPIFDKHGPRWLVFAGSAGLVASILLMSICTEYWHFLLVFGILHGTSASLLFTPSITAVGHWFKDRRGLATGVASTGGSLGGVVFPLMLERLFQLVGWAWAVRAVALVSLVCCGAANFLIRSRLPPARNASAHPDPRILADPAFALTTVGIFLLEFALFIPLTYVTSYMLAVGFDNDFAFRILPVLNAGSFFGRALPGWWADRAGPFNSNMVATLVATVACLAVWLPAGSTTAGIVVFAVLFGFGSGNNISISPVCIGRLCRTQHYGRYYATTYTVCAFAVLIGVPIAGQILTACGGRYWGLILFTGVLYCGGLAALWTAKMISVGWTNCWAVF